MRGLVYGSVREQSVCVSRCIALHESLACAFATIRSPWHFDYAIMSFADTLVILARGVTSPLSWGNYAERVICAEKK